MARAAERGRKAADESHPNRKGGKVALVAARHASGLCSGWSFVAWRVAVSADGWATGMMFYVQH